MQSENRLFDDFVKVMNGAAGTLAGMTREAAGRDAASGCANGSAGSTWSAARNSRR